MASLGHHELNRNVLVIARFKKQCIAEGWLFINGSSFKTLFTGAQIKKTYISFKNNIIYYRKCL